MKTQKRNFITILSILVVVVGFLACDNNDELPAIDVSGVYEGTLEDNLEAKSLEASHQRSAVSYINMVGNEIELRCVSEDFDETVLLNLYRHRDSLMVCLTGADFEATYGHRLGHGQMNGNMMDGSTDWMNHMYREHHKDDEHFGGFNIQNNSFQYTFKLNHGTFHFDGVRKN